jgi:hypothetical protein
LSGRSKGSKTGRRERAPSPLVNGLFERPSPDTRPETQPRTYSPVRLLRAGWFLRPVLSRGLLDVRTPFDEIIGKLGARVMDWKQELDALIESTMAFARDVQRQPIPDLPIAIRTAEQALADTSKPIPPTPTVRPASERDEIQQRVNNFKAHQQKMAREREDYYLQMKARMLAGR